MHRQMNTWWGRNMVCLCADQFAENHLESNGVDVKRSKLEGRSGNGNGILEYPDQLWNHVEMRECRQQRHQWKFLQYLHLHARKTRIRDASSQQQRRRRCGGQDEDGDLRPIPHESCENEGDWQSCPLHKHSRSAYSKAAERGRQIDRYWPDHHCTEVTGTQERHQRDDGIVENNLSLPWTGTLLL